MTRYECFKASGTDETIYSIELHRSRKKTLCCKYRIQPRACLDIFLDCWPNFIEILQHRFMERQPLFTNFRWYASINAVSNLK